MRNPETRKKALSKSGKKLTKVMFFMIPVFALFLKLVYRRSRKYYTEHLIFSLHFHSFYFLIGIFFITIRLLLLLFNIKIPLEVFLPFFRSYLFILSIKKFICTKWLENPNKGTTYTFCLHICSFNMFVFCCNLYFCNIALSINFI